MDIFSNEKEVWFDGPHTFADVYCNTCMAFLGYKYVKISNKQSLSVKLITQIKIYIYILLITKCFYYFSQIAGPAKKDNLSLQGHFLMKL